MSDIPKFPPQDHPATSGELDAVVLFQQMARGNKLALERFFQTHGQALFGVAMQMLGSQEDAEEVLQDTMVKLWQKAPVYDPARSRPFTWALLILRGLCLDRLRLRRRRLAPVALSADWDQVSLQTWSPAVVMDVKAAWEGLGDAEQELLQRAVFGPLTAADVAAADHEPLGTVKSRLRRTLQKFFHLLTDDSTPLRD
jgi:RNA polymerase sigma-70 factor (ECF subfamily)